MPNEMNHGEVEYYLSSMANINLSLKEQLSLDIAAADERRIANGELAEAVHAHIIWKLRHTGGYKYAKCPECGNETEIEHPVEEKVPYCSECGKRLCSRFLDYCPSCGALMDGKDDSHE